MPLSIQASRLIGKPIGISILNPDGSHSARCGIVKYVTTLGSEGGFSKYGIGVGLLTKPAERGASISIMAFERDTPKAARPSTLA